MYFILGSAKVLSAHHGGYGWLAKSGSSSVQPEDAPGPGDHEAPNGEDSTAALGAGKGTDSEGLNSNASTAPLDGVNAVADPAAALGGSLITMKKNVQGTMLLTITSNTVFLWSTRVRFLSTCRLVFCAHVGLLCSRRS